MSTPTAGRGLLVVGGAGPVPLSIDACRRAVTQAADLGLHVTVTVADADAPEARAVAEVADSVVEVDLTDPSARDRFLAGLGSFSGLVFGVRDAMQITVAEVAEALGVPGNAVDAVRRAVHKDLCRAALAEAGLPQPRVLLCHSVAEARQFLGSTDGPWIVKPRNASASIGVTRVSGPDDLAAAVAALPDPAGPFLVETFVTGDEFSIEGCFLGGEPVVLACTAKRKVADDRFVEVGHVLPAPLAADAETALTDAVLRAVRALGLSFGVFHVEAWMDADRVVLGEVHTRVGGDWIHSMVDYALPGPGLFGRVFADALGLPRQETAPASRRAAAAYLVPPPGEVAAVDGWADVVAHPRVLHTELSVGAGDVIPECRSSLDRVGVVVAGVPDATGDAEGLARDLCRSVVFTLRGGDRFDGLGTPLPAAVSPVGGAR